MFRLPFLLAATAFSIGAAPAPVPATGMLPDRTLECTLGRIVNFDPAKRQTDAELKTEGASRFVLFLPAMSARTTPPPDAIDPPEPVDPRTRIVADPDGLTRTFPQRFDRVIDLWPQRVELATTVDDPLVNTIVVAPIDETARTATLFMARATDVATYDLANLYRGRCTITTGAS